MNKSLPAQSRFKGLKIAITGANGSLGKFLINKFKKNGAYIVGLTHSKKNNIQSAEIYYKEALKLNPDHFETNYYLAGLLAQTNNFSSAKIKKNTCDFVSK